MALKKLLSTFALTALALTLRAQSPELGDSIELKGVEVTADRQYLTPEKSVFIPDTNQKQTAHDAVSLLSRMGIPQLIPTGVDAVKSAKGLPIAYFINGIPATEADLKGLLPTDVKRVEYLEYPKDIRFQLVPLAVNFIMARYEWGGYTKLSANGSGPENWNEGASIYSKFAYKRMTFDLNASQNYWDNPNDPFYMREVFNLSDYHGQGPLEAELIKTSNHAKQRGTVENLGFRAVYSSDKIQLNNIATIRGNNNPGTSRQYTTLSNIPELSGTARSEDSSNAFDAGLKSELYVTLPAANLIVQYEGKYTHRKADSQYLTNGIDLTHTNTNETAWMHEGAVGLQKPLGKHHSLLPYAAAHYDCTDTRYPLVNTAAKLSQLHVQATLAYFYQSGKVNINTQFHAGFTQSRVMGRTVYSRFSPSGFFYITYAPNQKHQFSLNESFDLPAPDYSTLNPTLQNTRPLYWTMGNPDLPSHPTQATCITYLFLPSNKWQLNATFGEDLTHNAYAQVFTPTAPGGEMLSQIISSGNAFQCFANLYLTLKLFNQRLILNGGTDIRYCARTGEVNFKHTELTGNFSFTYFLKSFSFGGLIASPVTSWSFYNGMKNRSPMSWNLSANYHVRDWNFGLIFTNPANWSYRHPATQILNAPNYTLERKFNALNNRARLILTATYTFRYGKRIAESDETIQTSETKSAVLK